MKKYAKILCMGLVIALSSAPVFASSTENHSGITTPEKQRTIVYEDENIIVYEDQPTLILPYLTFDDPVTLTTTGYSFVVSNNNLKEVDVTVTNHSDNPGAILFKIVDGKGKNIYISDSGLAAGNDRTVRVKKDAGKYSISAKAVSKNGEYQLYIDDEVVK